MRFLGLIIIAVLAAPALAHDPDPNTVEGQRVAMFKKSGAGIKAVFEQHLPAADFNAIGAYAAEMADWGARMTELFPAGSHSVGARDDIWKNWEDFEAKADQFSEAASELAVAAASGDAGATLGAAKALGAACKSCHESYRIKH